MPYKLRADLIHRFWFLCLIILFVINSVLIMGIQIWFVYRINGPVTEETVLALKEEYADSTVLDHAEGTALQSWLLTSPSGNAHIVTLEKHPFTDQYRVVRSGSGSVDSDHYADNIIADSARVRLNVTNREAITEYVENELNFVIPIGKMGNAEITVPFVFILYSAILLAIEFLLLSLLSN